MKELDPSVEMSCRVARSVGQDELAAARSVLPDWGFEPARCTTCQMYGQHSHPVRWVVTAALLVLALAGVALVLPVLVLAVAAW